ncbi:hypothetical protein DK842_16435 [Chromobacterium phragmitis]|nr:hypothetical protein DK842_16435 [Chromobacterium phragmitis]
MVDAFLMSAVARCTLAEAAENFLDGFHTQFVHAGWIRRDGPRQRVRASVRALPGGVEARYEDEKRQSGLISRLLESDRSESYGRFRLSGLAEIEYRGRDGLSLLVTTWMTPEDDATLRIHARVTTRKGRAPAWLKRWLLRRLFAVILRQDKDMLEGVRANARRFEQLGMAAPIWTAPWTCWPRPSACCWLEKRSRRRLKKR